MEMADAHGGGGPVILVGAGAGGILTQLARYQPERSVVLVEEPDVIRKRNTHKVTANSPTLLEVVEYEYQFEGAADALYHRYRDLRPSAVVPFVDYAVPFAARLAERYGVPGAGYGAAVLLRDKRLMRKVTAAAGVPNPESVEVTGPAEVKAFMAAVGGPIVLKPANRRASVGTKIVHDLADVESSWFECLDQDEGVFVPDRPMPLQMLAERLMRGTEFSVEMLVRGGRPQFAAVTRKFLFDGPRPVEQGHLHPADIEPELTERLVADTVRVLDAVGFDTGCVHGEWIVEDGVPHMVECAGRMAGDWIADLIGFAWPYDLLEQYVTMMKGQEPARQPATPERHAAIWMSHATVDGDVESVDGVEEARAVEGVRTVINVSAGDKVYALRSSWDRIAGVIADGPTPAEALARAQQGLGRITIKVRPGV
jgi:biotin carboxylase